MIEAIRENAPLLIIYLEKIARKTEAVRYLLEYENKQKYPQMWN
jgi:hypothetical protein